MKFCAVNVDNRKNNDIIYFIKTEKQGVKV